MERRPSGRQSDRTEFQYRICYPPEMMERCTCRMASAKTRSLRKLKVSLRSNLVSRKFEVERMLISKLGVGVFFDKEGDLSPAVYTQFLRKFQAAHQVTVFFHLRPIPQPTVSQLHQTFPTIIVGTYVLMLLLPHRSSPKTSSRSRARASPTVIE